MNKSAILYKKGKTFNLEPIVVKHRVYYDPDKLQFIKPYEVDLKRNLENMKSMLSSIDGNKSKGPIKMEPFVLKNAT